MAHSLTDFKSKLIGGGARPNLFEVEITPGDLPSWDRSLDGDVFKYMCKAANLPASNVASIDVPFRGRTFKVAGDRTFDTWTITVINDTDFKIRRTMEEWAQFVAQYQEASGATNPDTIWHLPLSDIWEDRSPTLVTVMEILRELVLRLLQSTSLQIFSQLISLQSTFLMTPLIPLKSLLLSLQLTTGILSLRTGPSGNNA